MSDPTLVEQTADTSGDIAPRPFLAPLVGAFAVLIGLSSLLDDTGLLTNPPWLPIALGVTGIAVAVIARTLRRLFRPDAASR